MKVGILTFHRALNYGAVLQSYALQQVLKDLGYDACIIDYKQKHIEKIYKVFDFEYFLSLFCHPYALYLYLKNINNRKIRNNLFASFRDKYLDIRNFFLEENGIYLIGSDQLWNVNCTNGVDDVFWGESIHFKNRKVYSYAISSNQKSINAVGFENLRRYVSNFSALSFRECLISEIVRKNAGSESRVDIDPTLLLDSNRWSKIVNKDWKARRYVLLYEIRNRCPKNFLQKKAEVLAQDIGCEVIDISDMQYSPEDFVSLFKYAEYIITNSFHGTVFSILFEKPLFVYKMNDGNDLRYVNLLNLVGAEELLVEKTFQPKPQNFDYTLTRAKISNMREKSISYLKSLE